MLYKNVIKSKFKKILLLPFLIHYLHAFPKKEVIRHLLISLKQHQQICPKCSRYKLTRGSCSNCGYNEKSMDIAAWVKQYWRMLSIIKTR